MLILVKSIENSLKTQFFEINYPKVMISILVKQTYTATVQQTNK
jgi:hypothetical protein